MGLAVALPIFTACYPAEEASPPPFGTTPANDRGKPSSTQNATLPDNQSGPTSGDPTKPGDTGACTKTGLAKGSAQAKSITVNGEQRSYVLSVPQGYGELPQAWRVVFAFHGSGGTGANLQSWYDPDRYAEKQAIVVYPDALGGNWDLDSPSESNRDIALFDAIIADLAKNACIDESRVFALGFSNGAYFANQLGCRRGDKLRAIAPHAGGGPYGPGSSYNGEGHLVCAGKPPAVKVFHAEDDDTVPISDAENSIAHWTWANGCQSSTHAAAPSASCVGFDGCGRPVEFCRYWGVGHGVWSEGAKATWDFFNEF